MTDYAEFIRRKSQSTEMAGFKPLWMPDCLFDFQKHLVEWSIRKGKSALFEDCGLGKTIQQLVWSENVVRHTNKPVLVITPLAVSAQTIREGSKFGIECARSSDGKFSGKKIIVTNYERLHHFDSSQFGGVVCDESSILKNFEGATKTVITEFMRMVEYRLLCTATAAPNDFIELGTSSEALGELGYMDMLGMFFKNDQNSLHPSLRMRHDGPMYQAGWRFKAHGETQFWRWVSSWARAMRKPSDLGFPDDKLKLPKLIIRDTVVEASRPMNGFLFKMPAAGLDEQRKERRHTIQERCEEVARKVDHKRPSVCWCHLNDEADLLEKLIPGARQVSGQHSDDEKEELFEAFESGHLLKMVIKPVIGAFGLNWQHCNHATFFPSHSYEQFYQGVRRCWRFGQTKDVTIDLVTSEGESDVMLNLKRKSAQADRMFTAMVSEMGNALKIDKSHNRSKKERVPKWLSLTS